MLRQQMICLYLTLSLGSSSVTLTLCIHFFPTYSKHTFVINLCLIQFNMEMICMVDMAVFYILCTFWLNNLKDGLDLSQKSYPFKLWLNIDVMLEFLRCRCNVVLKSAHMIQYSAEKNIYHQHITFTVLTPLLLSF